MLVVGGGGGGGGGGEGGGEERRTPPQSCQSACAAAMQFSACEDKGEDSSSALDVIKYRLVLFEWAHGGGLVGRSGNWGRAKQGWYFDVFCGVRQGIVGVGEGKFVGTTQTPISLHKKKEH